LDLNDWTKVTRQDIERKGATGLLELYHFSIRELISSVYPERQWKDWHFKVSSDYWQDKQHVRNYCEWLEKELNLKQKKDWYQISSNVFVAHSGESLVDSYRGSPYLVLKDAFPEVEWLPWQFHSVPWGFWQEKSNVLWYMSWLSDQIGICKMDDWYHIPQSLMETHGAIPLMKIYGGKMGLLTVCYPHHPWEANRENMGVYKNEEYVFQMLTRMFPGLFLFFRFAISPLTFHSK
jgi:hypothetical protein